MKIIDLYQINCMPYTSTIPVINAGHSHFSYTITSILPYDRTGEKLLSTKEMIVKQRQRYEKYRKENNLPLLDNTEIRNQKNQESYIYHITGMDLITSIADLEKTYQGGIRIFQPRREESNARWAAYNSNNGWLNQRGIQAVQRLSTHTAIIDCTNAHVTTIEELSDIYHKPMIIRTSSKSLHKSAYNYEDTILQKIIDQGWIICIPLDQSNIWDSSLDTWIKHIRYIISKRGDKQIAFASWRNGTLQTQYIERASHTQDINHIYEQLTKTFGKKTAEKILRNNAYRFLKTHFATSKEIN